MNQIVLTLHADTAPMTTCCVALLDLEALRLSYALAGHFPPLIRTPDGARLVPETPPGPPIGMSLDAVYATADVDLEPGDRLVLYTDGLVERRGESLTLGIVRLERSIDDCRDLAPQQCAEFLSDELSLREDDVAILMVEVGPVAAPG